MSSDCSSALCNKISSEVRMFKIAQANKHLYYFDKSYSRLSDNVLALWTVSGEVTLLEVIACLPLNGLLTVSHHLANLVLPCVTSHFDHAQRLNVGVLHVAQVASFSSLNVPAVVQEPASDRIIMHIKHSPFEL